MFFMMLNSTNFKNKQFVYFLAVFFSSSAGCQEEPFGSAGPDLLSNWQTRPPLFFQVGLSLLRQLGRQGVLQPVIQAGRAAPVPGGQIQLQALLQVIRRLS